MRCFICKTIITTHIFRTCDQNCCSKRCQIILTNININIDPKFKNNKLWITSYEKTETCDDDEDEDENKDEDELYQNIEKEDILDTTKNKMEKELSVIIYERRAFCCKYFQ